MWKGGGKVTRARWLAWFKHLLDKLPRGAWIVLDNASIHGKVCCAAPASRPRARARQRGKRGAFSSSRRNRRTISRSPARARRRLSSIWQNCVPREPRCRHPTRSSSGTAVRRHCAGAARALDSRYCASHKEADFDAICEIFRRGTVAELKAVLGKQKVRRDRRRGRGAAAAVGAAAARRAQSPREELEEYARSRGFFILWSAPYHPEVRSRLCARGWLGALVVGHGRGGDRRAQFNAIEIIWGITKAWLVQMYALGATAKTTIANWNKCFGRLTPEMLWGALRKTHRSRACAVNCACGRCTDATAACVLCVGAAGRRRWRVILAMCPPPSTPISVPILSW